MTVTVIGAGLAGVEAAQAITSYGIPVTLYEIKPHKYTPAHSYSGFAELVCSNSLKAQRISSASGLLKEEMRLLGSLVVSVAEQTAVPAGGALAVNRTEFSDTITQKIKSNPLISVINQEITEFPKENTVIATGPLTTAPLSNAIAERCGNQLSFYDAAAPIVTAESLNKDIVFEGSRYGKTDPDYLNCPFTKEEYEAFYEALVTAETAPLHAFEKLTVYEGCMPVEVLAKRGIDSVRYGCMKPVGLIDPRTGRRPYAAVQLRKEDKEGRLYNLVGFQTNLKFPEQKRVFSMIPGLENAEFVRYGVMHRNTFLNAPLLLDDTFCLRDSNNIYFAGQITGVEGYCESAASGIIAGHAIARKLLGLPKLTLPDTTMLYALCNHVSASVSKDFQPMGANMGILPPLESPVRGKQERYEVLAQRSLSDLKHSLSELK